MTLDDFRAAIVARDNRADVWLVYLADPLDVILGSDIAIALQQAFWTRGEAYALAHGGHEERRWQHYCVYRLSADLSWTETETFRDAEFESAFGRLLEIPKVRVRPREVAEALQP
jgi:hypothetical protein